MHVQSSLRMRVPRGLLVACWHFSTAELAKVRGLRACVRLLTHPRTQMPRPQSQTADDPFATKHPPVRHAFGILHLSCMRGASDVWLFRVPSSWPTVCVCVCVCARAHTHTHARARARQRACCHVYFPTIMIHCMLAYPTTRYRNQIMFIACTQEFQTLNNNNNNTRARAYTHTHTHSYSLVRLDVCELGNCCLKSSGRLLKNGPR